MGRDDFIGYRVLPLATVQTGLRAVFLYDKMHVPIEFSSLLVHITIKNLAQS